MSGERGSILDLLREVSLKSTELQLQGLHEYQRASLRLLGYGDLRNPSGRSALEDFAYEATRLSLRHYEQLLKLSTQHYDRIAGEVGRSVPSARGAAELTLKAIYEGRRAAHTLVEIENPHSRREDVTFSQVSFEVGDERVTAAIEATRVDGDRGLSLEPHESGRFKLEFSTSADLPAGQSATGRARVFVGDTYVGQLVVEVDVPPAAPRAARAKAKPRKVAKRAVAKRRAGGKKQ